MTTTLSDLTTLCVELNDLKRIRSAGRDGSIASRLFRRSWCELVNGCPASAVGWRMAGQALAAARLGDVDGAVLAPAGLGSAEIIHVLQDSIEAVGSALPPPVRAEVCRAIAEPWQGATPVPVPGFVSALDVQPRAGITSPGRPRIVLEPAESHAEHCLLVAVYGVLLASSYGADPGRVFLAALAHHFHNAGLPDSGFTGEMLLGPHLATVMDHYTAGCLDELDLPLRRAVVDARSILPDAASPEGRAFHAADVLDRVLQTNQYMRAASLTPGRVLDEMELIHAGPVKAFQDDVLRQAGLL